MGKLPRDLFEDELVPLCEKVTEARLPLCSSHLFLTLLFPSSVWPNLRGEDDDGLQREQPRLRLRHLQQQTGGQSSHEAAQQLRDQVRSGEIRRLTETMKRTLPVFFFSPELIPSRMPQTCHRRFSFRLHRNGRLLGVCASVDNCRLFVGGIPKTKKREEIVCEMRKVTDGVVDVIVYPSAADKSKNRGFAFVEYESHRAAAMARRKLLPGETQR